MTRKEKILGFMSEKEYTPMGIKDFIALLSIPKSDREEFEKIMDILQSEGKIYKNSKNKFVLIKNSEYIAGTFFASGKGYGFINDAEGERYYVPASDTANAFNKDKVLFKITKHTSSADKCCEARILKILSHSTDPVVGIFRKQQNFGFVIPDSKAYTQDIYISKKQSGHLKDGQKVVCKITAYPKGKDNPEGIIDEILGYPDEPGVDIQSLVREHGFTQAFPDKVVLNSLSFGDKVFPEEFENRDDFRNNLIFTIDGDDSKDFDDAVELTKSEDGYRLSVHIADVSHYVCENSPLDIEARRRGTSVYFPGFVIPMLPKKLSNGICSLNPDCERLTLSVIMDFDENGDMLSHQICESVICSKYRMTYNDVTSILNGDNVLRGKYSKIVPVLEDMHSFSEKLKEKRMSKGSINFDFPETKIRTDDNGKTIEVYKSYNTVAHGIIEEFMLCANVCVAEEMFWCEIPFIFRIHEKPSPEKIAAFSKFVSFLGLKLKGRPDSPHPRSFADVLKQIKGKPEELMVSKIMLRSLMKAKYSPENLGHFGLGFQHYCHFTSPIRRYPDLVIHRIIKEHLKLGITHNRHRFLSGFVEKASVSSSEAELRAMEAERNYLDMKKAEFMESKIGNVYEAQITSVTSFGFFAETEFGVEGLVSMHDLYDDYYEYDENKMMLIGTHLHKTFSIGDKVRIKVKRADKILREIDFIIESGEENE